MSAPQTKDYLMDSLSPAEYAWVNETIEIAKQNMNSTKFLLRFGRVYRHIEERPVPPTVSSVFTTTHELVRFRMLTANGLDVDQEVLEKLFDTGNTAESVVR
ncbi:MAG: hypothetical protein AAFO03_13790 [Bacteroidota bacterium]